MPNNYVNQISGILNEIHEQVTGVKPVGQVDSATCTAIATTALNNGWDPVMNAISQIISRTIFSIRDYSAKFPNLRKTESEYGYHVRKLNIADKPVQNNGAFMWPVGTADAPSTNPGEPVVGDGYSVDPYTINKPLILQTNFYGLDTFKESKTFFDYQLNSAFSGPEQVADFFSFVTRHVNNKLQSYREHIARLLLLNFMGGILAENNQHRVVHLLSEYNALTGLSLTSQTVYQPDNYKAFMQWAYSRIASICSLMTERTGLFQTRVNDLSINRHTPYEEQDIYLLAPDRFGMEARVLADTYHDNYLRLGNVETVNFWQGVEEGGQGVESNDLAAAHTINLRCSRIGSDGTPVTADVEQSNVFGVIMDREAAGYAPVFPRVYTTPMNADGGYLNTVWHENYKLWNDHTEKGVVLLLD